MDNENAIKNLGLRMIPIHSQSVSLDSDLIIADTDDYEGGNPYSAGDVKSLTGSAYPFKLEFPFCLICKSGNMRVKINLIEYSISENDLIVLMPGEIVQCLDISSDCRLTFIGFSDRYYFPLTSGGQVNTFVSFFKERPVNKLNDERISDLLYIISIMKRRISDRDVHAKAQIVKGYINALIYEAQELVDNILMNTPDNTKPRGETILADFMVLPGQNYLTKRSLRFYADKLCVTPKYLSQVVLERSGRHATEWIREYVLLEAKALLGTHQYSIQEISDRLNFANQSFFGTWFKKATGVSPRQYRQQSQ